ncbi:MAG: acyl-protein synthetase [Kangiella sp.]|nr:MAG: acyl-protein synthetase [Kangiella sp.]
MTLLESIHALPKSEKMKVMEFLWEEITIDDSSYISPGWHENVLIETEKSVKEGDIKGVDWSKAKQELRNEFK